MSVPDRSDRGDTGFLELDLREETVSFIEESFDIAKEQLQEENRSDKGPSIPGVDTAILDSFLVVNNWAHGDAVINETELEIVALFNFGQLNYRDEVARAITQRMETVLQGNQELVPNSYASVVPRTVINPANAGRKDDVIALNIGDRTGNTVIELRPGDSDFGRVHILTEEGVTTGSPSGISVPTRVEEQEQDEVGGRQIRTVPYDEAVEGLEESEEVIRKGVFNIEEDVPVGVITPDVETDEEPSEREKLRQQFPEVPEEQLDFIQDDGKLEIKAGKETKQVDSRDFYEFEKYMGYSLDRLEEEGLVPPVDNRIENAIGVANDMGRVGREVPASTFPRTVEYIKQHLIHEGPSYILEVYNDLVVYTGLIRSLYGYDVRAPEYNTMRQLFYRLTEAHERGITPQLIQELTASELQEEELSTTPVMELRGGETVEAPWLENRKYFKIVEDNIDHPAWDDITNTLYGEDVERKIDIE